MRLYSPNCAVQALVSYGHLYRFQVIFWNNNKVFGKTPLSEVLQQAIKQFNSPPSIAEK